MFPWLIFCSSDKAVFLTPSLLAVTLPSVNEGWTQIRTDKISGFTLFDPLIVFLKELFGRKTESVLSPILNIVNFQSDPAVSKLDYNALI